MSQLLESKVFAKHFIKVRVIFNECLLSYVEKFGSFIVRTLPSERKTHIKNNSKQ